MVDLEKITPEIIQSLMPLNPNKIILFGSYAYGCPNENSDIDLFLIKDDLTIEEMKYYQRKARKNIRELIYKYQIGFDILSAPTGYIEQKEDHFYKVDVLQNGKVLYEQTIS